MCFKSTTHSCVAVLVSQDTLSKSLAHRMRAPGSFQAHRSSTCNPSRSSLPAAPHGLPHRTIIPSTVDLGTVGSNAACRVDPNTLVCAGFGLPAHLNAALILDRAQISAAGIWWLPESGPNADPHSSTTLIVLHSSTLLCVQSNSTHAKKQTLAFHLPSCRPAPASPPNRNRCKQPDGTTSLATDSPCAIRFNTSVSLCTSRTPVHLSWQPPHSLWLAITSLLLFRATTPSSSKAHARASAQL